MWRVDLLVVDSVDMTAAKKGRERVVLWAVLKVSRLAEQLVVQLVYPMVVLKVVSTVDWKVCGKVVAMVDLKDMPMVAEKAAALGLCLAVLKVG